MIGIGQRFRLVRDHYDLTQVAFANRLGVTSAHISKIEKEKTSPSEAFIKLVCKEYGVNEEWLKEEIGVPFFDAVTDEGEQLIADFTNQLNKRFLSSDNMVLCYEVVRLLSLCLDMLSHGETDSEKLEYLRQCEPMLSDQLRMLRIARGEEAPPSPELRKALYQAAQTHLLEDIDRIQRFCASQEEKL